MEGKERMWHLVLTILLFSAAAYGQDLAIVPQDVAVRVNNPARFTIGGDQNVITAETLTITAFNAQFQQATGVRLFSTAYSETLPPSGYTIDRQNMSTSVTARYDLYIPSVQKGVHEGTYVTALDKSQTKYNNQLIIMDPVSCYPPSVSAQENSIQSFACYVSYLSRPLTGIPVRVPSLQWNRGDFRPLSWSTGNFTSIQTNATVTKSMDNTTLVCQVSFPQASSGDNAPQYTDYCNITIFVEYLVTGVFMSPSDSRTPIPAPGQVNCTANGRPPPYVELVNVDPSGLLPGTVVASGYGFASFNISTNSRSYMYFCRASNAVGGVFANQTSSTLTFSVTGGPSPNGVTSGSGTTIGIAVGVSVGVIVLLCIIVFLVLYCRKKKRTGTKEVKPAPPHNENLPPDTKYKENLAYAESNPQLSRKPLHQDPKVQTNPMPDTSVAYEPGQVSRHGSESNVSRSTVGQEHPDMTGAGALGPQPTRNTPTPQQQPRGYNIGYQHETGGTDV